MNNFDNAKWDASAWTDEMKTKWQRKMFELGYSWARNLTNVSNLHSCYYFTESDRRIRKDDDDHIFFANCGMVKKYYADVFPELAKDNFDEEFDSMFSQNAKCMEESNLKTSVDILNDCVKVQTDRGVDYDKGEEKERSFAKTAKAFNAITGKDITPAEVCLILQIIKDVRQWSQDRLHEDSVLDGVSYASLKGEELYKQYKVEL